MYKTQLIKKVAREARVSQKLTAVVVNTLLAIIQHTLGQHQKVSLPGFGSFYTRRRAASQIKHIRTGKKMAVPATYLAAFRAGEVLKRQVRQKRPIRKPKAAPRKKK